MTSDEANEVLAIVRRIGPVVLSSAVDPRGEVGSGLRRAVGMMVADYNMIHRQTFCVALRVCLDLARHSKATLVTMDRVRKAALAEMPISLPATLWVNMIVRLTLATEARIVARMSFRSRDEVDAVATSLNDAFNQTSERAADDLDTSTYMALIRLHSDVVKYLADVGRQLPRVIEYKITTTVPALRMAQHAYHNPSRYIELVNENDVVHPAFMPREGRMLSI